MFIMWAFSLSKALENLLGHKIPWIIKYQGILEETFRGCVFLIIKPEKWVIIGSFRTIRMESKRPNKHRKWSPVTK